MTAQERLKTITVSIPSAKVWPQEEGHGAQISPGFGHYPSLLSVAEMKHQLQSSCRGKSLAIWLNSCPSLGSPASSQTGAWMQDQKQRLWRNTAYWLVLHSFLSLLLQTRATRPGVVLPTVLWATSINLPPRRCLSGSPMGHSDGDAPLLRLLSLWHL